VWWLALHSLKLGFQMQYLRHFSQTLDFACAPRRQNQGFEKNGNHGANKF